MHSSGRLDEDRFPSWEVFWIWVSVEPMKLMWTVRRLDYDNTLRTFYDRTYIIQNTWTAYFAQCDNFATTYAKCDTEDTLCEDHDDTCAIVLKILEMSATHVYMVRPTHLRKYYPLKPSKLAFIWYVTLDVRKYDTLIFLQMGPKHLEKTHVLSIKACEDSMKG